MGSKVGIIWKVILQKQGPVLMTNKVQKFTHLYILCHHLLQVSAINNLQYSATPTGIPVSGPLPTCCVTSLPYVLLNTSRHIGPSSISAMHHFACTKQKLMDRADECIYPLFSRSLQLFKKMGESMPYFVGYSAF